MNKIRALESIRAGPPISNARATDAVRRLTEDEGPLDHGPYFSRLLIRVIRALARGRPVSTQQANGTRADLGIDPEKAEQFLRQITERDADDNIVGIMGLSLNDHPHRIHIDNRRMYSWCAEDTLFLPAVLDEAATVESRSPTSGETVQLRVSPKAVEEISPADAVVSMVIVAPDKVDVKSVEGIWSTFCHSIYFFPSRKEAERWSGGRNDIEIISVTEAYELGKLVSGRLLAYE